MHTFLPCHSVLRTFPGAGIVVFPLLPIGNFWKMEHAHRSGWIVDRVPGIPGSTMDRS